MLLVKIAQLNETGIPFREYTHIPQVMEWAENTLDKERYSWGHEENAAGFEFVEFRKIEERSDYVD